MKKEWPSVGEKKSRAVMDTAFFNQFIPGTGLRPGLDWLSSTSRPAPC